MNSAAHDRHAERRIAKLLADLPDIAQGASPTRSASPINQGITPTALRRKVHQLGPTAHLVRVGKHHYVATIGRKRFEGYLGEVNVELQPLFDRFQIS